MKKCFSVHKPSILHAALVWWVLCYNFQPVMEHETKFPGTCNAY